MNYTDLFKLISKQWASAKDIMIIVDCGRDTAISIRDTISAEIIESGKKLPKSRRKIIPMQYLIEYLNIDLDYMKKMVKMENETKNGKGEN